MNLNKRIKEVVLLLIIIGYSIPSFAQSPFSFGFKTGLTFSQFRGPSETDFEGRELENYSNENGFHVGAIFKYRFTSKVGLESGFFFHQKGTKYNYKGDSWYIVRSLDNKFRYLRGDRDEEIQITNAYIHLPLAGYAKLGNFEFSAGVYVDFLVGSIGQGEIIFDGVSTVTGDEVDRFRVTSGYKYIKDNVGEWKGTQSRFLVVDGESLTIPKTNGAYYIYSSKEGNLFNTVDFGLTGGIKYFLNKSLFIGSQLLWGISDVTNNEVDYSIRFLRIDRSFIFNDDKDTNLSLQLSLGFSF